ncbi:MAG: hypothetical protein J6Y08_09785 [Clostridiales bacterium]|nr:hypothetical protein [Clostridiales bacterium]
MHTVECAAVFSLVFAVLCSIVSMNPVMYLKTHDLAELSVHCQDSCNKKTRIFEVFEKQNQTDVWKVENSCPEKAYRLSKGVRDSFGIMLG